MNTTDAVALPSPDYRRTIKFCVGLLMTSFLTMLFVVLVTVGAVICFLPKEYFSKVTMEVKPDYFGLPGPFGANPQRNAYDPQFIATQLQTLQKTEVLYPVIDRLELTKVYAPPGGKLSVQEAYLRLKNSMKVQEVRNTGLIEIGVYDTDPQRAADIANTIALIYQEVRRAKLEEENDPELQGIQDEVDKQRKATEDADAFAKQIQKRDGITDSNPVKEDSDIGFTDTAVKAIDAQAEGREAQLIKEARMSEYREAKKRAIQMRKILETMEIHYEQQKMVLASRPPTTIIWEKAEKSSEPARPNVMLCALVAAPVGLILGAGLFLIRNRKTRPSP
jgi:uncharacterized protein involved in exopolysaccharide biosynthesis